MAEDTNGTGEVDVAAERTLTRDLVDAVTVEAGDEQEASRKARSEAGELAARRRLEGAWFETEVSEIREVGE